MSLASTTILTMSTPWTLTFDAADPPRIARFWAVALGYTERPVPNGFASWEEWLRHYDVPEDEWDDAAYLADPDGVRPSISFLKVPESKVAKNRIHLDIQAGGGRDNSAWEVRWPIVEQAIERLTAAGATVLHLVDINGRPDHAVMADPEGNEFCVL